MFPRLDGFCTHASLSPTMYFSRTTYPMYVPYDISLSQQSMILYLDVEVVVFESRGHAAGAHDPAWPAVVGGVGRRHVHFRRQVARATLRDPVGVAAFGPGRPACAGKGGSDAGRGRGGRQE